MEDLIFEHDWAASPLGARSAWSEGFRTVVDLILRSDAQIVLFWGPEFVALYNDAYAPTIGDKHPRALGCPAHENWSELWDDLGPLLSNVRETGATFSCKDRPFYIERHGFGETVYFDVSYSAVPQADGSTGGVLCIVEETTARVLAERRLAESERRLRALVEATSGIIFSMSADWSQIMQLDGKDLLADVGTPRSDWMEQLVPPADRPTVETAVASALAGAPQFECEHRVYLKNGDCGWVQTRAVPIFDDRGELVEWFGTASDVTPEHQQREHLQVVVHELDHRVKNTLAMVQAIARQTFRSEVELDDAHVVFTQRVKAIAGANALLAGDRRAGTTLRAAIELAILPYAPGGRLGLDGGDIALTPKTALAVSLAMHELATNAVRYGAWSGDDGFVRVLWQVSHQREGSDIAIDWKEQGGPAVSEPSHRGFGTKIVERGLAAELNGEVQLLFEPDGVHCRMHARLPATDAS